jgi:hypothetical protein
MGFSGSGHGKVCQSLLLGAAGVDRGWTRAHLAEHHRQRLRTNADIASAPILAASIFLDILHVFLFFLLIFSSPSEV